MTDQAINQVTTNGETALTAAAGKGLEKVCELLIPKMTEQAINYVNTNGVTALTAAAGKGLEKVCELLIPKMTEQAINVVTKTYGDTALTRAASSGLEKVCEILIPKMTGQAINQVTTNGNTALTVAASNGLDKVCEMLIPKMSNNAINQINNNGVSALPWITKNQLEQEAKRQAELIKKQQQELETKQAELAKLAEEKAEILNNEGKDLFSKEEYDKAIEKYNEAIKITAKPIYKENKEKTEKKYEEQQEAYNQQLILEIEENKIEEAKNLISLINSNYFNKVDNKNNTALHYAVDKSLTELSMLLINQMNKEAISAGNIHNNTALHYATDNGLEEVSWFLINNMTQKALDMVNTYGYTALDYAIYNKLIITGFLAKKMSLEVVRTVNANCKAEDLASIKNYENLEQYNKTRDHEKVIGECFPLPAKPQLPSLSLKGENTVAVGLYTVLAGLGTVGGGAVVGTAVAGLVTIYYFCFKKNTNTQDLVEKTLKTMNDKLENSANVNEKDNILTKIEKLKENNVNLQKTAGSIQSIINKDQLTRGNLLDLNDVLDKAIAANNKVEMEKTMGNLVKKVLELNVSDIHEITSKVEELVKDKITAAKPAAVKEDVDQLIEQQPKSDGNIIVNIVNEIVYDNPLLNHPGLLQPAMEKFSLKEIGELSTRLSPDLITQAISNEDNEGSELILGGLRSLEYNEAPAG